MAGNGGTNEVADQTNDSDAASISRSNLLLGSNEEFGAALVNEKSIIELAYILKSLGDYELEADRSVKIREAEAVENTRQLQRRVSVEECVSKCFLKVCKTLDRVLGWLEQSSKNDKDEMTKTSADEQTDGASNDTVDAKKPENNALQKKEAVLRGLYHITGLGSYTYFVGLLELASKFLDLPENPYHAKREHIKACLEEVEENQQKAFEKVEKACDLLEQISTESRFDQRKVDEFNVAVRQANGFIDSCKDWLTDAEDTTDELMTIMNEIKIFSRLFRLGGCGVTCYALYHVIYSSKADSLASYLPSTVVNFLGKLVLGRATKPLTWIGACAVSGCTWLSFFPSRAYAFRDELEALKLKHERLTRGLERLELRLRIAVEEVQNRTKQWQSYVDSV